MRYKWSKRRGFECSMMLQQRKPPWNNNMLCKTVVFVLTSFPSLLLNHSRRAERRRKTSHLYYKPFLGSTQTTTLFCHITSGRVRRRNPINSISIFWGRKSSLSCCRFSVCWIFVPKSICEGFSSEKCKNVRSAY